MCAWGTKPAVNEGCVHGGKQSMPEMGFEVGSMAKR